MNFVITQKRNARIYTEQLLCGKGEIFGDHAEFIQ